MKTSESTLTRSQFKKLFKKVGSESIEVVVRYDDQCGNGHNSFSITGGIWTTVRGRDSGSWGCIHEEIEKHFPELQKYIKWHLCSSDGPMHYVANTMYHARTCSHDGKSVGDPVRFETFVRFGDFPKRFKFSRTMTKYLKEMPADVILDSEIIEIHHKDNEKGGYQFAPKLSLGSYPAEHWHECPFDSMMEVEDFLEMVKLGIHFVEVPTAWAEAVEPNLKAARSSAIWPDATLEQLQDREALEARLPALLEEFRSDMEELGFVW